MNRLQIEAVRADGSLALMPIAQIDNFAMRNFTNDANFDDTLPVADGVLEVGNRVPLHALRDAMEDWFRRKSYLAKDETLRVTVIPAERFVTA